MPAYPVPMRYKRIFALIAWLAAISSQAQENNAGMVKEGDLFLNFRNISFVRNNEYSNPITEGYTLIGWFIQPELVYRPVKKAEIRLGAHLLSFSGTNRFSLAKPVFSTTWFLSDHTRFTIGSLQGSDSHKMLDPHFSREKTFTNFSEDGLQLVSRSQRIFSDTWVSWEKYIFRGDNEREIFTAGESFIYTPTKESSLISLEIPVQLMFKHYGGQISDYPEPVETFLNLSAGAKALLMINREKNLSTGLEAHGFYGNSMRENASSGVDKGHAFWLKAVGTFSKAEIEAGYWISRDYYAPDGNFIYGSVSDHLSNVVLSPRKLITGCINFKSSRIGPLEFNLGIEGWYDTSLERFDNAVTLHLQIDELVKLVTVKRQ